MFLDFLLTTSGLTALLVLAIVTLLLLDIRRPSDLPPGPPIWVPVLGNLIGLTPKHLLQQLREYRVKYGDVFSLKMGSRWWIVFNGYDTIRDVLIKNGDVFSSRPDIFQFNEVAKFRGIVAAKGHFWKEQRTFALTKLREFGFGKRSVETNILEEVEVLIQNIESQKGQPFDIYNILHTCVSNIICTITFGKRFDHTDPMFVKILSMFKEHLRMSSAGSIITWLPFLKYLPSGLSGTKQFLNNKKDIENFIGDIIDEHRKTFDENNLRDYIDAFIAEKNRQDNEEETTFTDCQLKRTIHEFFFAGTETAASTLLWAIIYLIRNPEVQEKMRQEIDKIVGSSQFPRLHHRLDLPYIDAVITEVQRCGDIAPLAIFHAAERETTFQGFRIPTDAVLTTNLNSVMHDPTEFPDPYKFNPLRFIDKDGKLCKQEKVIAFSLGRRACLGESLARMELFLFLTAIVQRFKLLPLEGKPPPSEESVLGLTRSPLRFKFRPVSVT